MNYTERGWLTLPLKPKSKLPATAHGVKDAGLNNLGSMQQGVATGKVSGIFVVDVDIRNGGDLSFGMLDARDDGPGFPDTYRVNTPTGGWHLYYKYPEGVEKLKGKLAEGIDIKSDGGYVVAPPSEHPDGGLYEVVDPSIPVATAPEWLVTALEQKVGTETHERREFDPTDKRPGTLYDMYATWEEILEPIGYRFHHEDNTGTYWTRPGKELSAGHSLTTNYNGSGLLHNFSTEGEFPQGETFTKFGAYAHIYHADDMAEAAFDLAKEWVPDNEHRWTGAVSTAPPVAPGTKNYEFSSAFPPEHFVSRYLAYVGEQTDAAFEYGEAGALSLLSAATPLLRGEYGPNPKGLKTNLYLLFVGASTRSRKSTSQGFVTDMLDVTWPNVLLPNRATTEALINDMAMRRGSATLWAPDEFGAILAQINRRDYLKGIEELLLTIYGGDDYDYIKVDGDGTKTVHIAQPHLSVLGASTPETIALSGPNAMLGGLLPRFGIVFPSILPEARPATASRDLSSDKKRLREHLYAVGEMQQRQIHFRFNGTAMGLLNEAEWEFVDHGTHVARLPAMLYKVALLSAAGALRGEVNGEDAEAAIQVVRRWKDGADTLQPYLRKKTADMEFERYVTLALDTLKDLGGTAHRALVAREVMVEYSKMSRIEATLMDRGYISVSKEKTWSVNNG